MVLKEGGLLPEHPSEAQWVMGSTIDWSKVAKPPRSFEPLKIQYNQDEYLPNTCTVYSVMGTLSDLLGKEYSLDERKAWVDEAVTLGLDTSIGWWINKAVDQGGDKENLSYASTVVGSEDFREALNRGFSLVGGYRGNKTYNKDRDDDMEVDSNDWGKYSYQHAIRFCTIKKEGDLYIIDNYEGRPSNVYSFPELQEKIAGGNLFTWTYFYFTKIDLTMANLPEHIRKEDVMTPKRKEIVIAWENEVSKRLNDGNDVSKLYKSYTVDVPVDETDVICRMLIDLKLIRAGAM